MSRFSPNAAFTVGQQVSDPGYQRDTLLEKKRRQPRQGGRVRQVMDQSLLDQGIDPDATRTQLRQNKELIREAQRQRIQLGQGVRDARRVGDTDRVERLQGQVNDIVAGERSLIEQRRPMVQLTRPSLSRLPESQQREIRDDGRQRLLDQLPAVATAARDQATDELVSQRATVAGYGRQAISSALGRDASDFTDDEAAEFFLSLPSREQRRFTLGVPLPTFPQGLVDNAERLDRLAETGDLNFSDREIVQRPFDPFILRNEQQRQVDAFGNQVRAENASRNLANAAETTSRAELLRAQAGERQAGVDLGNVGRDDRVGDAEARAAVAEAEQRAVRAEVVEDIDRISASLQGQVAVRELQKRLADLGPEERAGFDQLPDSIPAPERARLEFMVPDELVDLRSMNIGEELGTRIQGLKELVRSAAVSMTAKDAKAWANRALNKIRIESRDGNDLEYPAFGIGTGDRLSGATGALFGAPRVTRLSFAPEIGEHQREYGQIIRELKAMAGVNE